ncbi:MAG: M50 family metallopeptidase [Candidatus Parcubacteria bacterium]|nr:M50 family metallopeptidase [Candidatus Parcubacteria bacterium]
MVSTVIIAFLSLIILIVLHEFGHFIVAKHFGVRVEEFGVGLPPRIYGKKKGETIYSLNAIPLGGFVRLYGEEENIKDPRSFSGKPILQRALIILAGVASFWIISFIIFTFLAGTWGLPIAVDDQQNDVLRNAKVTIIAISSDSPAAIAGLKPGDVIQSLQFGEERIEVSKIQEVSDFASLHKGEEIKLIIKSGIKVFETSLIPRVSYPEGQGPIGVALLRNALKSYTWYQAPIEGFKLTAHITVSIPYAIGESIIKVIKKEPVENVEMRGVIGIVDLLNQSVQSGINNFLYFIAILSIYFAVFNILPIPALDGGKIMFLAAEKIKGKPISEKFEQKITTFFFILLLGLTLWITITKDIPRLF